MKTIRLLTIGNSFARNALTFLADMAASAGHVHFEIGCANLGGCSLEKHWNLACHTKRQPQCKIYTLGHDSGGKARAVTLTEALRAASWDYVTLQQASRYSWRRETYQPYLGRLHGMVRRLAPRARIMLHQTWAYRADAPFLPQHGLTQAGMFARIRDVYAHYAAKFGCGILPVGAAIQRVRGMPRRRFRWPDPDFDYQRALAPALPRQPHSMAVGWYWSITGTENGMPELKLDANHLNALGCYLAGCVWFECLTGIDARKIRFCPPGISRPTAGCMRDAAHAACRENDRAG